MAPECSEVRNHALTFTNELNFADHEKQGMPEGRKYKKAFRAFLLQLTKKSLKNLEVIIFHLKLEWHAIITIPSERLLHQQPGNRPVKPSQEMDEISATGGHRVLSPHPHRPVDPTKAPLAPSPHRSI
jgi:hypothetical protein